MLLYMLFDDVVFFFFKQKTAYEMRISDWSSDVCSSDLQMIDDIGGRARSGIDHAHLDRERQPPPVRSGHAIAVAIGGGDDNFVPAARQADSFGRILQQVEAYLDQHVAAAAHLGKRQIGRASCRERGCAYV